MKRSHLVILIVLITLIIDQAIKIWVKTNMHYGEDILIFGMDWARFHFVENKGMAFGITFWGDFGKLILSLFRLVAIGGLIYYIKILMEQLPPKGLIISFALILAGAIGNILDSAFYGLIFSESYHGAPLATFFPPEGGYESFLYGRVVDMFYFPMVNTYLPEWLPLWGGKPFQFFRPVFNFADSAIFVGVLNLLLFHRSFFNESTKNPQEIENIPEEAIQQY